jgi:hypothetical protein
MSGWLRTRIGLGLLSIAGMTAGHYLSYWFVAPDSHHRDELLEATGHAGESPFVVLSIAALLATCIAVFGGRTPKRPARMLSTVLRLAAMQTVAFLVVEAIERASQGTPLLEAAREPVVWLGILAQLAVAGAGAALLRLLQRAASVGISSPPPSLARPLVSIALDTTVVLFSKNASRPWEARGPPLSS